MKASVIEPERQTSVVAEADVIVAGGGPAGLVAAIAAARNGASTVLVERYGFLGGMATAALVGPFSGVRHRYGGGRIAGGIAWELIERLSRHQGALVEGLDHRNPEGDRGSPDSPSSAKGDVPFDPEILKWMSELMAVEAGVTLYYHTLAVGVRVEESKIKALLIESKSGRQAIVGRVFVDCTGDADLSAWAGVPFETGRQEDGALQPLSLMFRLSNVDTEALGQKHLGSPYIHPPLRSLAKQLSDDGKIPVFGGPWTFWGSTFRPGEVMVNMVRLWGDATDRDTLTRLEITAREHIQQFVQFLKQNFLEFQHCVLMDSGTQIGIRETRRIVGEYQLTEVDIRNNRTFKDTIGLGGHVIDIHSPGGGDWSGGYDQVRQRVGPYQIPYRALLPVNIDNLLVAGRPISATHEAHASLRVMGTAMITGQAAGTAAALAAQGTQPRLIDVDALQRLLIEQGALIDKGLGLQEEE